MSAPFLVLSMSHLASELCDAPLWISQKVHLLLRAAVCHPPVHELCDCGVQRSDLASGDHLGCDRRICTLRVFSH